MAESFVLEDAATAVLNERSKLEDRGAEEWRRVRDIVEEAYPNQPFLTYAEEHAGEGFETKQGFEVEEYMKRINILRQAGKDYSDAFVEVDQWNSPEYHDARMGKLTGLILEEPHMYSDEVGVEDIVDLSAAFKELKAELDQSHPVDRAALEKANSALDSAIKKYARPDEPRPTDPSVLEKGIMATDIGSKVADDFTKPYPFKGIAKSLVDADNPDLVRALVDEEQAFDTLSYVAGTDNITPGQQQSAIKQVYDATQSWLKNRPDTITVYRYGELRGDEPVSFTLDPNFTGKSLPWLDRTGSEGLQAYTVNKKDILAAPNAVLRPGMGTATEHEVIIPGSRVSLVGDEPGTTDPLIDMSKVSTLDKGIAAAGLASKITDELERGKKRPPGQELVKQDKRTGKGQMFRGLGSLMKSRIFPLVAMAKTFWDVMPEDIKEKATDDAGAMVDWLRENKMHELVGLDKSGLEYFKEALGLAPQGPTDPMAMPNLWDDTASRMQRARDMGFDLDETLYHGTSDDIKYFSLTHPNRKDSGWLGTGVYLTDDPSLASIYGNMKPSTSNAGPNILPVHVKLKNPYYASINDKLRLKNISFDKGKEEARAAADAWTTELKKKGHDGVILEFDPKDDGSGSFGVGFPAHKEVVVFEPENIRSSFAKFDPADADSDFLSKAKGGFVEKPTEEPGTTDLEQAGETADKLLPRLEFGAEVLSKLAGEMPSVGKGPPGKPPSNLPVPVKPKPSLRRGIGGLKRAPFFALVQMGWDSFSPEQKQQAKDYAVEAWGSFENAWEAALAWKRRNLFESEGAGGLDWAKEALMPTAQEPKGIVTLPQLRWEAMPPLPDPNWKKPSIEEVVKHRLQNPYMSVAKLAQQYAPEKVRYMPLRDFEKEQGLKDTPTEKHGSPHLSEWDKSYFLETTYEPQKGYYGAAKFKGATEEEIDKAISTLKTKRYPHPRESNKLISYEKLVELAKEAEDTEIGQTTFLQHHISSHLAREINVGRRLVSSSKVIPSERKRRGEIYINMLPQQLLRETQRIQQKRAPFLYGTYNPETKETENPMQGFRYIRNKKTGDVFAADSYDFIHSEIVNEIAQLPEVIAKYGENAEQVIMSDVRSGEGDWESGSLMKRDPDDPIRGTNYTIQAFPGGMDTPKKDFEWAEGGLVDKPLYEQPRMVG